MLVLTALEWLVFMCVLACVAKICGAMTNFKEHSKAAEHGDHKSDVSSDDEDVSPNHVLAHLHRSLHATPPRRLEVD